MSRSRSSAIARFGSMSMRRISMPMRSALTVVTSGGHRLNGGECAWFDREVECGGEADGAEHAELVFAKPQAGVADGADQPAFEVVAAADVVDDFVGDRVEEQAVDREVAALGVVLGGGEVDAVGVAAVAVRGVGAERGDFDLPCWRRPSTVITPNAAPMASVRGGRRRRGFGRAWRWWRRRSPSVRVPSSWSRTQPPAQSASKPAARSFSTTSRANSRWGEGWAWWCGGVLLASTGR